MSITRREALRRIFAATAFVSLADFEAFAGPNTLGHDPDLLTKQIPWDRALNEDERHRTYVLGDLILPADEFGPAASAADVIDFVDEWVSAPYSQNQRDLATIRDGLRWIEEHAQRAHRRPFVRCEAAQQQALLAECAKLESPQHAFFRTLRRLVVAGYYTAPVGWPALGYTGNVPSATFAGPPPEALKHLGLL